MVESTHLPTLDDLRETTTFTAMAEWLTACPLALFVTHGHEIRAICEEAGFVAGAAYTASLIAVLHGTRQASTTLEWSDHRIVWTTKIPYVDAVTGKSARTQP